MGPVGVENFFNIRESTVRGIRAEREYEKEEKEEDKKDEPTVRQLI